MDALTHLFLPLTVLYVLYPEMFKNRYVLGIGALGLFSDFDKFLGVPGLLHSLLTLVPICLGIVAVEKWVRGSLFYASGVSAIILSHPLLDVIDGGPAPLFAPLVERGIGFQYPMRVSFGQGTFGIVFQGPFLQIARDTPRSGFNTYGFVNPFGVVSVLLFVVIYVGLARRRWPRSEERY